MFSPFTSEKRFTEGGHTVKVNAELLSVEQGYEGGSSGVYRYFYNGEEYVVKIDLTKDKPDNALAGFAEFKASLRYEGIAPHTEWPKERVLLIDPNNPSSAVKNYEDKRRRDREETKANLIVLVIFIAIFAPFIITATLTDSSEPDRVKTMALWKSD